MAESKNKSYFIKDTSIDGIDSDLFNYADISKVLERILESNEPPYNIAIIGKWNVILGYIRNIATTLILPIALVVLC